MPVPGRKSPGIPAFQKGQPNGVAPLDGGAKVPVENLPDDTGGSATYVPWYPFIASTAHAFSVAGSTPTARNSSLVVDRAGSYRPKLMVRVSAVTGSPTLVRVTANVALYAVKPDGTSRTLYAQNDEIAVHDNGSTYATNDFAVLTGGAISLNAGETIMQNGNSNPFRFLCNGSGTQVDAFSSAFYLEKQ